MVGGDVEVSANSTTVVRAAGGDDDERTAAAAMARAPTGNADGGAKSASEPSVPKNVRVGVADGYR
jgi:hypothetical protein